MGDILFKNNASELIKKLARKKVSVHKTVLNAMNIGMIQFHGHIERTQMSGRPGLKTQTGNLKRSWYIVRLPLSVKLATREKYARIHQYGGVIRHPGGTPYIITKTGITFMRKKSSYKPQVKFTKPHNITMPKRLHVYEKFQTVGRRLIMKSILVKLRKELYK